MRIFRRLAAAVLVLVAAGNACAPARDQAHSNGSTLMSIVGRWRKTSVGGCGERYPDALEFTDRGVYTGRSEGGFTLWDAGGYELLGDGQVRISTANDAEIPYRFTLAGDELTFRDPDGCAFAYRREG